MARRGRRGRGQSRPVVAPAEGQKSGFLQVPNLFHQARSRAQNGCAGAASGYQCVGSGQIGVMGGPLAGFGGPLPTEACLFRHRGAMYQLMWAVLSLGLTAIMPLLLRGSGR